MQAAAIGSGKRTGEDTCVCNCAQMTCCFIMGKTSDSQVWKKQTVIISSSSTVVVELLIGGLIILNKTR